MKNLLKEYFYYTRAERNGAIFLLILLVVLFVLPNIFGYLFTENVTDYSAQKVEIAALHIERKPWSGGEADKNYDRNSGSRSDSNADAPAENFAFDPNTASKNEFVRLGLSERTATIILNYREKGGKFFKKEDFKKIYGINLADYERLEPLIQISSTKNEFYGKKENDGAVEKSLPQPFNFNPNTATQEEFMRLGLTEKVTKIILNYRNKGGNFRKKEDFAKVFGVTPEMFQMLEPFIQLEEKKTQLAGNQPTMLPVSAAVAPEKEVKFGGTDINTADFNTWKNNFGLEDKMANSICNYRNRLGGFAVINQLKEAPVNMPDSIFNRIKPQLKESQVLKKININSGTEQELFKHPYIGKKASAIVNYRTNYGNFKNTTEVGQAAMAPIEWQLKIGAYLAF